MRRIPFWLLVLGAFVAVYFWQGQRRDNNPVATVRPATPEVVEALPQTKTTEAPKVANKALESDRLPASKNVLDQALPASLRGRAKFENTGGYTNHRHVTVSIDEAELIGAKLTVNDAGDKIVKSALPSMPETLPRFPKPDVERMKDKIDGEIRKQGNVEAMDTTLVRKIWLPVNTDKKLQPAVEYLVKTRDKETNQTRQQVFQFDAGSGELLSRFEPVRN